MRPPELAFGGYSTAGVKSDNQDAFGFRRAPGQLAATKGIAFAIADGLSTSAGARNASALAVGSLTEDYLAAASPCGVKESATLVLDAANRHLLSLAAKTHGDPRAMATTLTGCIVQGGSAHVFHVGDTRLSLLRGGEFTALTKDHRALRRKGNSALTRTFGTSAKIAMDYACHPIQAEDLLVLTSDGVHEFVEADELLAIIAAEADLEACCKSVVAAALRRGSGDNLTCLLARIVDPGAMNGDLGQSQTASLPVPALLSPGQTCDGYTVIRELHASSRTQMYLVTDNETGARLVLKTLSPNFADDPHAIEAFNREIWVGGQIDNPHVMRIADPSRPRRALYYTAEFIEGQTLRQWMLDHPLPDLATARNLVEQLVKAVRAFHRRQFVHLDLKPENIMLDGNGTLKIVDFGSATPMGGADRRGLEATQGAGTVNYTAPEVLRGEPANNQADIYSLGVITYEMLTGRLPHGASGGASFARWARPYQAARLHRENLPAWVDYALEKAVHPRLAQRHDVLSGFLEDLKRPNPAFSAESHRPLLERNPVAFWRALALLFFLTTIMALARDALP